MRRTDLAILFALLGSCSPAFAWGPKGHAAIADAAWVALDPAVQQKITALLQADRDVTGQPTALAREFAAGGLAGIASWPDEVKAAARQQGPLANDPEAASFNLAFPDNGSWHFVNLPLGAGKYRDGAFGTASDDVVHEIEAAIKVLESPTVTPGFNRAEAVAMLVHLVGDVYQPVHCGCGYYTLDGAGHPRRVDHPQPGQVVYDDRGANFLELSAGPRPIELHIHWDIDMVTAAEQSAPGQDLAKDVGTGWQPGWTPAGDYHDWAASWASDTVHQARALYHGVIFGTTGTVDARNPHEVHIPIRLQTGYDASHVELARTQMRKAACRLRAILSSLQWAP